MKWQLLVVIKRRKLIIYMIKLMILQLGVTARLQA